MTARFGGAIAGKSQERIGSHCHRTTIDNYPGTQTRDYVNGFGISAGCAYHARDKLEA